MYAVTDVLAGGPKAEMLRGLRKAVVAGPLDELRRRYVELAQPRLGAEVVFATDDFFADKARLIDPAEPVFIPGKYDENGKWLDGWESRRKRIPGHD